VIENEEESSMAKKNKRQGRSRSAPQNVSSESTRTSSLDFNPDYSYVIKDLKRIGILAGSFFIVLIVLSGFLN